MAEKCEMFCMVAWQSRLPIFEQINMRRAGAKKNIIETEGTFKL